METNQYPNNPVPRGGDKIQITAANNSNATRWKAGDIVEVLDGKADYWGKPAFCAYAKAGWGDRRRKVWNGPNAYSWKIVERDGKPYVNPAETPATSQPSGKKMKYLEMATEKILSNETLTKQLSTLMFDTDTEKNVRNTAKNIVSLAAAIADEMIRFETTETKKEKDEDN